MDILTIIITSGIAGGLSTYFVNFFVYLNSKNNAKKTIKKDIASTISYLMAFSEIKQNIIKDYMILESDFTETILKYNLNYELLNFYLLKNSLIKAIIVKDTAAIGRICNHLIFRHNNIFDKNASTEPFEKK